MKSNPFFFNIVVIFFIYNNLATCNFTNQPQRNAEVLELMQGRWVLLQNKEQELLIKKDTVNYLYSGRLEGKYILRISSIVVSKTFENDTIKGKNGQLFIE